MSKLDSFLVNKGYVPLIYYTQDNYCFFVEVISKNSSITFLIYIPSKYSIPSDKTSNCYELVFRDPSNTDELNEAEVIPEIYDKIDIDDGQKDEDEDTLENLYKRSIPEKNAAANLGKNISDIYKQLRRLRHCVGGSNYKTGISNGNILGVIRRDDSIECYEITGMKRGENNGRLYVITDLDMMYEKHENIDDDIIRLHYGIYSVMDKSRDILIKHFSKVLSSITGTINKLHLVYDRKNKYGI